MAMVIGLAVMLTVLVLAHQQPWLGLKLAPAESGLTVKSARGPAQAIPSGTLLVAIENKEAQLDLTAFDLTTEPDGAMGDYTNYERFLSRQAQLANIENSPEVTFTAADGQRFVVHPHLGGRPLADLPVDFWVQCAVGLIAWLVAAAVFAFRPAEASARYLLLSGAATLLFAPAAAVYTTRELAVSATLLRWACDLNFLGGSLFAASFVGLLLVYPRRIAPTWMGFAVVAAYIAWFIAQQLGCFESMTFARRFLVMLGVGATFLLAAWHWRSSDRDPLARAKLLWFLLSWVVGTGTFALFILLPQTFGVDTSPIQGYAFLLFLLVYGGLAMGILRYRLFELGEWWRRVLKWTAMVLLLITLDLFFLYVLQIPTNISLVAAVLICGLLWLPLRSWLWKRVTEPNAHPTQADLFRKVMQVALEAEATSQLRLWRELIESVFQPLEIISISRTNSREIVLQDDGLSMDLPALAPDEGLRLSYAKGGQSLFGPHDKSLATELVYILQHGLENLAAYRRGVTEERGRMTRDMHDNIGAQLLSALHSSDVEAKDTKIRESLADLRKIANANVNGPEPIAETLADLRVETSERLDAVGLRLDWQTDDSFSADIPQALGYALRPIIREAINNVIRHAQASQVSIRVQMKSRSIHIEVSDNGRGFDPSQKINGNGLDNIRTRVEILQGRFTLHSSEQGSTVSACIPLDQSPQLT
jgi:signal transduction histidine kinase